MMFVVGRNVEVKVEKGKVTIICQTENDLVMLFERDGFNTVAITHGSTPIPTTNLRLDLTLHRRKTE